MRALTLALLLAVPVAEMGAAQVRDNTAAPIGTASIAGRVFADDASGQPLRRVSVTLSSGGLRTPQMVLTDDAGRFRFANISGGTYALTATRPGFVPAFYGSKQPGKGPGIPIAVLDGQHVTNIDVRMFRGGVITGTVRSQSGKPAPGVDVMVQQIQTVDGRRRMSSSISALMTLAGGPSTTDDRGIYRVYGLPPGDYIVQTTPQSFGVGGLEARQTSLAESQWAQQVAAQSASPSSATGVPPTPESGGMVTYAPVYFPGTTIGAEAGVITLGPGEERRSVDFTTQLVPTARITGIVFDPEGRPLSGAQISLRPSAQDSPDLGVNIVFGIVGENNTTSGRDGTFAMNAVKPGRYSLSTRGAPPRPGRQGGPGGFEALLGSDAGDLSALMAGLFGGAGQPWWASEEIAINGRDLTNVAVHLQPGMTISGRLVFEGTSEKPADVTKTPLAFGAMPSTTSPIELAASMFSNMSAATISADGTFVAKGITPGKYRASLSGIGSMFAAFAQPWGQSNPWTLKSAMWNGRDIADVPLEVKPSEDLSGVVVTMTDKPTELSGAVIDQAGRPTGSFPIIVFSTDRLYWTVGSRRVKQARPASNGKFKVNGLPPGEYYVCAVTDLDPEDLYNPAFLDQLAAAAYKIKLADGQKLVQDLQLR